MEPEVYDEMFAMEESHWWFRARRRIVMDLLRRHVSERDGVRPRLADLGCGCGANLQAFKAAYDVWGVDAAPAAVSFSRRRVGADRVFSGALPDDLPLPRASFDAVVMTDVLEHIEDDATAAAVAIDLLVPGGVFVATVPAGQWLYSRRDAAHHHKRRYARAGLSALFEPLPVAVELLSYCNSLLFAPAAMSRLASKWTVPARQTDLHVPPAPVNRALEAVFGAERHLLGRVPLPCGLSLVVVARRQTAIRLPAPAIPGGNLAQSMSV